MQRLREETPNYILDEEFLCGVYKEPVEVNGKTNNPLNRSKQDLIRHFTKEETWKANKQIKKPSAGHGEEHL
jgi:hypothetical protein